jgi:hypothetical protein
VEAVAGDQRLSRLAMNASRSARVASVSSRPRGLEEGGELTDADQVAGHGAVGEVLGAQVPLEGAAEAGGRAAVHDRTVAQ